MRYSTSYVYMAKKEAEGRESIEGIYKISTLREEILL